MAADELRRRIAGRVAAPAQRGRQRIAGRVAAPADLGRRIAGGGVEANELLTAAVGAVLLVLLAVEGVTIVFLRPLLFVHMFLGMLLVPVVLVKLASTGYRFVRYYAGARAFRAKGPPPILLRVSAPVLVATTLIVFATGTALLVGGTSVRGTLLPIHKISFIVWGPVFVLHILAHLPATVRALRPRPRRPGTAMRGGLVLAALLAGLVVALVLAPDIAPWMHAHRRG